MSPKLGFFCNVENLYSEPLFQTYFVTEDRLFQVRPTAAKITAGIQGRF